MVEGSVGVGFIVGESDYEVLKDVDRAIDD